jgi:hypothetical protein
MHNNIIPMPYPRMMGGNTATYEQATAQTQKGGKRKRKRDATKRRQNKKGKWTKKRR